MSAFANSTQLASAAEFLRSKTQQQLNLLEDLQDSLDREPAPTSSPSGPPFSTAPTPTPYSTNTTCTPANTPMQTRPATPACIVPPLHGAQAVHPEHLWARLLPYATTAGAPQHAGYQISVHPLSATAAPSAVHYHGGGGGVQPTYLIPIAVPVPCLPRTLHATASSTTSSSASGKRRRRNYPYERRPPVPLAPAPVGFKNKSQVPVIITPPSSPVKAPQPSTQPFTHPQNQHNTDARPSAVPPSTSSPPAAPRQQAHDETARTTSSIHSRRSAAPTSILARADSVNSVCALPTPIDTPATVNGDDNHDGSQAPQQFTFSTEDILAFMSPAIDILETPQQLSSAQQYDAAEPHQHDVYQHNMDSFVAAHLASSASWDTLVASPTSALASTGSTLSLDALPITSPVQHLAECCGDRLVREYYATSGAVESMFAQAQYTGDTQSCLQIPAFDCASTTQAGQEEGKHPQDECVLDGVQDDELCEIVGQLMELEDLFSCLK